MKTEEYESVKKWFAFRKKPYAESTKKEYIGYMALWCKLADRTPDELASEDSAKMRGIIAEGMRKLGLSIRSVIDRTNAFNGFLRANGKQTKETYEGIPEPLRKEIERVVRLHKIA